LSAVVVCLILFLQMSAQQVLHEEERELYNAYFDQAGAEFSVPSDILRGLSFAETRWTHMRWTDDDTNSACSGMPRVYGVMGLWNNEYFGYSLRQAAELIDRTPEELKDSPLQNIRGAAALLKKYYEELPAPEGIEAGSLESWQNAIARFSGIPQNELAQQRGWEIYSILSTGYARDRITIPKRIISLDAIEKIVIDAQQSAEKINRINKSEKTADKPDYPLAKWNPARTGHWSTTLIQQKFVVVHDVEGSYLGCISWFQNPNNTYLTSAHYILNSHPNTPVNKQPVGAPDAPVGEITQMVEERYRAHHVGCWNSFMIGIEHEGYYNVSGWYTQECYESSSGLVNYLCEKYDIPKDRNHVIAHSEHQNAAWRNWVNSTGQGFDPTCNTHIDPGQYWNWTYFMDLVTAGDTVKPQILTSTPGNAIPVPTYKDITVTFNTSMDAQSTVAAFSILPSVSGSLKWNGNNTVLTYDPINNLAWNTTYTVTIDTSAKNISKKKSLGGVPFEFSFTTVPMDTAGPVIVWSYPYQNAIGVPVKPEVILVMNDVIQTSSLSTTLKFSDVNNVSVPMTGAKNENVDDLGVVTFQPSLKPNTTYTIRLFPGIKDYYNNVSTDSVTIQFKTDPLEFTSAGIVLDQFESNGRGWVQPNSSPLSTLLDTGVTSFTFTSARKFAGTNSGNLKYKFADTSGGVLVLAASSMPVVDQFSSMGMWIYGDMSRNRLKFTFDPDSQSVDAGVIHWRGWKFILIDLDQLNGSGIKLTSLRLIQEETAVSQGSLYFDDMQVNPVTTSIDHRTPNPPSTFTLGQNYPNPFNPTTTIEFQIPNTDHVQLTVYDVLGRMVKTLINEQLGEGSHVILADMHGLNSGVYYYRLKSGGTALSKKMIFLK
jgi:N-acetyl-anhydromuramyl-L-alanine amidase AmpD